MSENAEIVEDRILARRAAAGSDAALATLYERYADSLFAFIIHRMRGDRGKAEDVYQETWLAALSSMQTYRGKSRLFSWLCGIARHKIADRYPRTAKAGAPHLSGERLSSLLDPGPLPEELVARRETRELVVRAMAFLPDEYRDALLARYVEGQSVQEVAAGLDRSYKATESVLSRARAKFREALSRTEKEEADG